MVAETSLGGSGRTPKSPTSRGGGATYGSRQLLSATPAPQPVQLPPMPAGDENKLRAWHIDCLRLQHASIPDALSGKQLDTLRDCVPIAITGKDAEGRPLAGVRDAASLAGWLQQLAAGEGVLVTAEPAAGKTWLLSQV